MKLKTWYVGVMMEMDKVHIYKVTGEILSHGTPVCYLVNPVTGIICDHKFCFPLDKEYCDGAGHKVVRLDNRTVEKYVNVGYDQNKVKAMMFRRMEKHRI